ncbi:DsbA family protein [Candidatus Uhrbacteria bacterium]|nr:DsbA family protein [Candidatus Uhrbacteria bacterium]
MPQAKQFIAFFGIIVAVFLAALLTLVIKTSYESVPERTQSTQQKDQILSVSQLALIDNGLAFSLGHEDAKVVVVEFLDYQCEFCKHVSPTLQRLTEDYKDTSVRFVIRHFPLQDTHPFAYKASHAALCAREQNAFLPMHNLLFQHNQRLNDLVFAQLASQLHIDVDVFASCMADEKYQSLIRKDVSDAVDIGITGVPTFFINKQRLTGAFSLQDFKQAIDHELRR